MRQGDLEPMLERQGGDHLSGSSLTTDEDEGEARGCAYMEEQRNWAASGGTQALTGS